MHPGDRAGRARSCRRCSRSVAARTGEWRLELESVVALGVPPRVSAIITTHMSILGFCQWLAATPWSIALHESQYMYSVVESLHVLNLTLFVGLAAMLDLRLLGMALRKVPISEMVDRLMPWLISGFIVMVATGLLLFLLLAGLNVWVFHRGIYKSVAEWTLAPIPPRKARLAGLFSIMLWASIIIAGRMIAYNWFDCDIQPQSAIVNWWAGCGVEPR